MEVSIIEGCDSMFFFGNIHETLDCFFVSIEKMGCYAFPYSVFKVHVVGFFLFAS